MFTPSGTWQLCFNAFLNSSSVKLASYESFSYKKLFCLENKSKRPSSCGCQLFPAIHWLGVTASIFSYTARKGLRDLFSD